MIDPMAGLDESPAMASEENTKEVFDSMTLQRNLQRVDKIRSVMGIASGCAAGIVGFTGLEGFGTYGYSGCMEECMSASCVAFLDLTLSTFVMGTQIVGYFCSLLSCASFCSVVADLVAQIEFQPQWIY